MLYAFGEFELDSERCTLSRNGRPLELKPKSFDLLLYLVDHPRRIATKDELLNALWKDVSVTENSLTQCVTQLRQSLGEAGAKLVRTVPRRGYILEAEVSASAVKLRRQSALRATIAAAAILVIALLVWLGLPQTRQSDTTQIAPWASITRTILGQPFVYPEGRPLILSGTKTLAPGQSSDWHSHDRPLVALLLSGELVLEYENRDSRRFGPGDTFVEALDTPHRATNVSSEQARIAVVELSTAD